MVLIVGLGNPGKRYQGSRHNLGFQVVERLATLLGASSWKRQQEALVARGDHAGRGYLLAKPQTYMNRSGAAVQGLLHYYRIALDDCLVIVDDLDLPPGKIRQRSEGSDGGHRGLRSVIEALGRQDFKRVRIGIGRPPDPRNVISYVLGGGPDREALDAAVEATAQRTLEFIGTGSFENWSSS